MTRPAPLGQETGYRWRVFSAIDIASTGSGVLAGVALAGSSFLLWPRTKLGALLGCGAGLVIVFFELANVLLRFAPNDTPVETINTASEMVYAFESVTLFGMLLALACVLIQKRAM